MFVLMLVKLYTSRVLLEVLGIDDYGIWNVVAAFVVSFSFISSPLVTATQRFLNFDMGKGGNKLNQIFCVSLEIFIIIGIIIVIGLETFGLWFLNNKMVFPSDSITSANWVFHFCVITFFLNFIRMSYEAAIVANERMSFYAVFCIVESSLLLGIALILQIDSTYNKLIIYAFLTTIVTLGILFVYVIYCHRYILYTRLKLQWNKTVAKEIGSFSGWNLFGGVSSMTANQGLNIILNMFFGVVLNAAYGISMQIRGAVSVILDNLLKAANPQIVKNYSLGEFDKMQSILSNILKASYLLCFIFMIPMIINMELILKIWLGDNIPPYTLTFARLTLLQLLIVCLGNPIDIAIFATGKIKSYQLCLSSIIFLNIIITYLLFHFGFAPEWALIVKCIIEILVLSARILYLKIRLNYNLRQFIKRTILPLAYMTVVVCLILFSINHFISFGEGWHKLWLSLIIFLPTSIVAAWLLLIPSSQRHTIVSYCKSKIYRRL